MRSVTRLEQIPIGTELRQVDFRPRLNHPLLTTGKPTRDELNRVDRDDRYPVLVVRVKVGPMMLSVRFGKHPNDDAEKSRNLWHMNSTIRTGVSVSARLADQGPARYRLAIIRCYGR